MYEHPGDFGAYPLKNQVMLDVEKIFTGIRACGVDFFTGVPDSLLKEFCACVTDRVDGGSPG